MPEELHLIDVMKVHGHGKIVIPEEIRKQDNIKDGDKMAFYRDSEGKIFIIKIERSQKSRGYTPTAGRA